MFSKFWKIGNFLLDIFFQIKIKISHEKIKKTSYFLITHKLDFRNKDLISAIFSEIKNNNLEICYYFIFRLIISMK